MPAPTTMTLRRDVLPASPCNPRLSRALRLRIAFEMLSLSHRMLKKILATTTLFGVSVLSIPVVNAAIPGVYVTGQLGYAQTDLKDKMKAFNSYFGSQTDLVQVSGKNNIDNNGLAGRLAIGYQFNCNFAVEMGYLQIKQVKTGTFSFFHDPSEKNPFAKINLTANQHAFDIAAKGIMPLANNFNVYGKLGVAYLNSTINIKGEKTEDGSSRKINIDEKMQESKFAPEIVVGVSYAITPNVSLDTSLTHIHNFSKNSAGNVNFFAAGISYNFG